MADFQAIVLEEADTVATAVADLAAHSTVRVVIPDGGFRTFTVGAAIPFGHKFAIRTVLAGQPAIKYGERIGVMNASVEVGDHVHVHNLESERGRGDLKRPESSVTDSGEGGRR